MTVSATATKAVYAADGSQKVFPYTFKVLAADDLDVYFTDAAGVDTLKLSGFTVDGIGDPVGGNVTFSTAPPSGVKVTLIRVMQMAQGVDLTDYSAFPASTLEFALDHAVMLCQQINEKIDRFGIVSVGNSSNLSLPSPSAGKYLRWDSLGSALENYELVSNTLLQVSEYMESLLDAGNASEARGLLGLSFPLPVTSGGTGVTSLASFRDTLDVPFSDFEQHVAGVSPLGNTDNIVHVASTDGCIFDLPNPIYHTGKVFYFTGAHAYTVTASSGQGTLYSGAIGLCALYSDSVEWKPLIIPAYSSNVPATHVGILKLGGVNMPQNATRYLGSIGIAFPTTPNYYRAPYIAKLGKLRVLLNGSLPSGQTFTISPMVNGVATGSLVMTSESNIGTLEVNTVVSPTAEISIRVVSSAITGSTIDINATLTVTDKTGVHGVPMLNFAQAAAAAASMGEPGTTGALAIGFVAPCDMTIQGRTNDGLAPDLSVGGVLHRLTRTRSEPRIIGSGSRIQVISDVASSEPTVLFPIASERNPYNPDAAPCLLLFTSWNVAAGLTRYCGGFGTDGDSATFADVQIPAPPFKPKSLSIYAHTNIPTNGEVVANIMKASLPVATVTLVAGSNSARVDVSGVSFAEGDPLSVQIVTNAFATFNYYHVAIETGAP